MYFPLICFVCSITHFNTLMHKSLVVLLTLDIFFREISFEEIEEMGVIIRAWELSKRMLIYCLYVNFFSQIVYSNLSRLKSN